MKKKLKNEKVVPSVSIFSVTFSGIGAMLVISVVTVSRAVVVNARVMDGIVILTVDIRGIVIIGIVIRGIRVVGTNLVVAVVIVFGEEVYS